MHLWPGVLLKTLRLDIEALQPIAANGEPLPQPVACDRLQFICTSVPQVVIWVEWVLFLDLPQTPGSHEAILRACEDSVLPAHACRDHL